MQKGNNGHELVDQYISQFNTETQERLHKVRGITDEAVEKVTGKGWGEWFTILSQEKADKLQHSEIAKLLSDKHKVEGWWAQNISEQNRQIKLS